MQQKILINVLDKLFLDSYVNEVQLI